MHQRDASLTERNEPWRVREILGKNISLHRCGLRSAPPRLPCPSPPIRSISIVRAPEAGCDRNNELTTRHTEQRSGGRSRRGTDGRSGPEVRNERLSPFLGLILSHSRPPPVPRCRTRGLERTCIRVEEDGALLRGEPNRSRRVANRLPSRPRPRRADAQNVRAVRARESRRLSNAMHPGFPTGLYVGNEKRRYFRRSTKRRIPASPALLAKPGCLTGGLEPVKAARVMPTRPIPTERSPTLLGRWVLVGTLCTAAIGGVHGVERANGCAQATQAGPLRKCPGVKPTMAIRRLRSRVQPGSPRDGAGNGPCGARRLKPGILHPSRTARKLNLRRDWISTLFKTLVNTIHVG